MDEDYSKFLTISEFAPELSEFLHEAKSYSYFDVCCRFVQYLCNFVFNEPLIHVLHDQPSELVRTLILRFLKQSVFGRRLENSCGLWI